MTTLSVQRPGFLALALVAPGMWWAWRTWPPPLPPRRRRFALALRLVMVGVLVLALAGVRVARHPDRRAVVAVVDLSDSTIGARDAEAEAVRALGRAKRPADLLGVVTFGRDAQVELSPTRRPSFLDFQTRPDGGYSDLAGALRLAANLVPAGFGRQLVLVSDGQENVGDAAAVVDGLRSDGVRVDVLAVGAGRAAESLLVALEAPGEVRMGQALTATARLRSSGPSAATITLEAAGRQVEGRHLDVPAGESNQAFSLPRLPPGVYRLRATLEAERDTYAENNTAEAVVRVIGPPSVLILEGSAGAGGSLRAALTTAGMQVDTRAARDAPTDVVALSRYDSIVVADAAASDFPERSLGAIASAVRDLGRGLVAIGGGDGYGAGGWGGTPLEESLPVRMEVNNTKKNPNVAVAVAMESMETPQGDLVALGALQGVIDKLTPNDEIAFVADSVVVPLTKAADKASIARQIAAAQLDDPPGYLSRLQLALDSLRQSDAGLKHMVLIADGDATADTEQYQALFDAARAQGVTISAVGVDIHSDAGWMAHMAGIAEGGGGRFYRSERANDVPQILLRETQRSLRPWFEQQPFFPRITSAGDLLSGVPLEAFPELGGYVATTAKASAEVALSTPKADPLLAGWQYGLGRAVAWTSDANGRWTAGFLGSPVSGALFARMVAWSMPPGGSETLEVDATPSVDGLDVEVSGSEAAGGDVRLQVVAPDLTTWSEQLRQVASGRWRATVEAPDVGTYSLHAELRRSGAQAGLGEASVAVPYSPEYLSLGRDDGRLRLLARKGGRLLARPTTAWSLPVPRVAVAGDLFWVFLLVAVLLWPLDVAGRRLMLTPRQLASVVRSLVHLRRPSEVEVALPPALAHARERVDARRRREAGGPAEPDRGQAAPGAGSTGVEGPVAATAPGEHVGEGDQR